MAKNIHRTSATSYRKSNGRTHARKQQDPGQPQQLALLIEAPKQSPDTARKRTRKENAPAESSGNVDGLEPSDRVVNTHEAVRIAGKHRATLFRWARDGKFPQKRMFKGGKRAWVLSDIERWIAGVGSAGNGRPKSERLAGNSRADRHRHRA